MDDAGFPKSLDTFCKHFKIDFFDLRLQCIFCLKYLDLQELAGFHLKALSLIYKNYMVYACCPTCLRLSALYEKERFFQCIVNCDSIEYLTGKAIKDLPVRCIICLKLLDLAEKFDIKVKDEVYCLIRGHWRGPCRACIRKE
ncbi:E6 [Macaca mulatta papillomavirus 7]|uniref:E6 n=1 Tax=Macaca mulatta papillomavirus 7 TaxID=2364644 RepID=UPI000EB779CE|nr:E6 [Macaca mulatta papillomavirus 7]AYD74612.1 E6 [Macaca mulatta papillomavirus 7]